MGNIIKKALNKWRVHGTKELCKASLRKILSEERYFKLIKYYYRVHGYTAIGDPLRVYNVSPNELNYISTSDKAKGCGFSIVGGEWYKHRRPFEKTYRYSMFKKHFEEGIPWEQTEEFQKRAAKIRNKGHVNTLDVPPEEQSVDVLRDYYKYIDKLYYDIKNNGYKRQEELTPSCDFAGRNIHPSLNEVQVCISPSGTMMVESGYHRYTIAKMLEIEIPVHTKLRHTGWQNIREEIYRSNGYKSDVEISEYTHHPEVQDIV